MEIRDVEFPEKSTQHLGMGGVQSGGAEDEAQ
jgi:hypothetical protein